MRLEQTIRETIISESADMDARLQQLVRAGLMPQNTLPLLRKSITKVQTGMPLQGMERDVMATFINSMMFIVLGDDAIFNRARSGAKGYATEEVELDETAKIVSHLVKRYGDNVRKSHVMSAAKDFGVDSSKLSKAVRKRLGKTMLGEEEQEYDYEGDMAMSQLKSIIANSQRMHDSMSENTNLPEWVQSKITLAEDYITTAANYLEGEMSEEVQTDIQEGGYRSRMAQLNKDTRAQWIDNRNREIKDKQKMSNDPKKTNEEVEELDELSNDTLRSYRMKAKSIADHGGKMRTKGRELAGRKSYGGRMAGVEKAKVMATEDVEQLDELSPERLTKYKKQAEKQSGKLMKTMRKHFDKAGRVGLSGRTDAAKSEKHTELGRAAYGKALKRSAGAAMASKKLAKEEIEQVDEISKATMGRYINKAKDSIDSASYRQGAHRGDIGSPRYNNLEKKLSKRHKGIETAVKKLTKEESENLDELSKATMGRYINKAATKMGSQGVTAGLKIAADEKSSKNFKDMGKREKGISRAVKKLTKEDIDAVKQMNESYKTAFETALNEYGIKSPSELDESKRKEFFNYVDLEFKKGDN
jgi:hypothetical protein